MSDPAGRVLYLVVCAAPAAADVETFVRLAQDAGWRVFVITTPMGRRFVDVDRLAAVTGEPVRTEYRMPGEPNELPGADAVVVAPATFNTINKWAAGMADSFAVGLLCELVKGLGLDARAEIGRRIAHQVRCSPTCAWPSGKSPPWHGGFPLTLVHGWPPLSCSWPPSSITGRGEIPRHRLHTVELSSRLDVCGA